MKTWLRVTRIYCARQVYCSSPIFMFQSCSHFSKEKGLGSIVLENVKREIETRNHVNIPKFALEIFFNVKEISEDQRKDQRQKKDQRNAADSD